MSWFFTSGGQSIRASASETVLPMNIQCWFPLGLTGLIALLSKWFSRVFFNTTVRKHHFFGMQLIYLFFYWRTIALQNFVVFCQTSTWISLFYGPMLISIHEDWKNHCSDHMNHCQPNDISFLMGACVLRGVWLSDL